MNPFMTVESYLDGYLKFLKDHSIEEKIDENISKLTLPFLDSLNDCTEIYIIKQDNEFIVTDNGETLSNLAFNGVIIKEGTRKNIFTRIINSYGVLMQGDSLYLSATYDNLFLKKHLLLQCICKVNDMFMLNRTNIQNIFDDEVRAFFDNNDVYYVPDHKVAGRSGLLANFDFAIPQKRRPLTFIKTLNRVSKDNVKSTIFDWNDTRDLCEAGTKLLVLYNDTENNPKENHLTAFKSYNISDIPWSNKPLLLERLAS